MTVENLVLRLADKNVVIKIVREHNNEEIYHGKAMGAVEIGYGNYLISRIGPNGLVWYW